MRAFKDRGGGRASVPERCERGQAGSEGRRHEPRQQGGLWKLEEAREQMPRGLLKRTALLTPWFQLSETHPGLLTPRL